MDVVLLVASGGGHLKQLTDLLPRLRDVRDLRRHWVTYDTPQSRSLLEGEAVTYAYHPTTRNIKNAVRNVGLAERVIKSFGRNGVLVSTGAAVAVPFTVVARAHGWVTHYIESATRVAGPSLSGRMVRWVPGANLYAQYPSWASPPWKFRGSVFDAFEVVTEHPRDIRRVVVALGTHDLYPYDRLVGRLVDVLPPTVEVLWQTGSTDVVKYGIHGRPLIPAREFEEALGAADAVVAHAGTGVALASLEAGKMPVLAPRLKRFEEHVDDHQLQLGQALERAGLAVLRDASSIVFDDLREAASSTVRKSDAPPVFELTR